MEIDPPIQDLMREVQIHNCDPVTVFVFRNGSIEVQDIDGVTVFNLNCDPGDRIIGQIMAIHNGSFDRGVAAGKLIRSMEIRNLLEVPV
jgi:hypothetical protein